MILSIKSLSQKFIFQKHIEWVCSEDENKELNLSDG